MSPRDIKYATMNLSGKSSYEKDNDMPNEKKNDEEHGKDILAKQEQSFVTKAKKSRTKKRAKQS